MKQILAISCCHSPSSRAFTTTVKIYIGVLEKQMTQCTRSAACCHTPNSSPWCTHRALATYTTSTQPTSWFYADSVSLGSLPFSTWIAQQEPNSIGFSSSRLFSLPSSTATIHRLSIKLDFRTYTLASLLWLWCAICCLWETSWIKLPATWASTSLRWNQRQRRDKTDWLTDKVKIES